MAVFYYEDKLLAIVLVSDDDQYQLRELWYSIARHTVYPEAINEIEDIINNPPSNHPSFKGVISGCQYFLNNPQQRQYPLNEECWKFYLKNSVGPSESLIETPGKKIPDIIVPTVLVSSDFGKDNKRY